MPANDVVFWGLLKPLDEDSLIFQLSGPQLLEVDFDVNSGLLDKLPGRGTDQGNQVSILGHLGEDPRLSPGEMIIPSNVVLHSDVAVRAFEIYESRRGGSALDNWLAAERQLLESPPTSL